MYKTWHSLCEIVMTQSTHCIASTAHLSSHDPHIFQGESINDAVRQGRRGRGGHGRDSCARAPYTHLHAQQHDLENAVGGSSALKRAGGKAMLANKAMANIKARRKLSSIDAGRRRPSREGADGGYFAFVSHMKAEAAMEARFLQIELEAISSKEEKRRRDRLP